MGDKIVECMLATLTSLLHLLLIFESNSYPLDYEHYPFQNTQNR
jgi:hypothetical protein